MRNRPHAQALAFLLASFAVLAAPAEARRIEGCHHVPAAHRTACEPVWEKCYRGHEGTDRYKCLGEWAARNVPAHLCTSDDFEKACSAYLDSARSCTKPHGDLDPSQLHTFGRFVQAVEDANKALSAVHGLERFGQCIGKAAYKEFGVECARRIEPNDVAECRSLGPSMKAKWAAGLVKVSEHLAGVATTLEKGGDSVEKEAARAEKLIATVEAGNANPVLKGDFDAAALRAKLQEAQKSSQAKAGAAKADASAKATAREEAEAQKTAEALPKAKLKNKKLAAAITEQLETKWKGMTVVRVILSSKKWTTNYLRFGSYETRQKESKESRAHVIVKYANERFCKLYDVYLVRAFKRGKLGPIYATRAPYGKATLCPGE